MTFDRQIEKRASKGSSVAQMWIGAHSFDLRRTHVAWMPQAMPTYEETYPVQVHLFSTEAIAKIARPLTHLVQQAFGLQGRSAGFHG